MVFFQIVKALIEAGSDLNLPENNEQLSPLHATVHHHHHEAAILLINAGKSPNMLYWMTEFCFTQLIAIF